MVPLGIDLGPSADQRASGGLLCEDPATAPHEAGALVVDDTGDRKDGTRTAHVARQYLGSVGKIDNGIVAVTSLWADERCYWPIHAVLYTPASRLPGGERHPGFKTKPQLALELVQAAQQAGVRFRAVVADCFYGDNPGFTQTLGAAGGPFVLALKPRKGAWAPAQPAHTPVEAAGELGWRSPTGLGSGGPSSGTSATATPRLGGRPTRPSAALALTVGGGWWWPPPTPVACRQ